MITYVLSYLQVFEGDPITIRELGNWVKFAKLMIRLYQTNHDDLLTVTDNEKAK